MKAAALPVLALFLTIGVSGNAQSQSTATKDCPPAVTTGSESVTIGGRQAARSGDGAGCGKIVGGSSNVIINGRPAATAGSQTDCGGSVVTGAPSVFINGKPVARSGDAAPCPPK